jgi:hypothetical protein
VIGVAPIIGRVDGSIAATAGHSHAGAAQILTQLDLVVSVDTSGHVKSGTSRRRSEGQAGDAGVATTYALLPVLAKTSR